MKKTTDIPTRVLSCVYSDASIYLFMKGGSRYASEVVKRTFSIHVHQHYKVQFMWYAIIYT